MEFNQMTVLDPQEPLESSASTKRLRFVDAFAGLGGFHVALSSLGHECVFACELNAELRGLYEKNYGLRPVGDIREVSAIDVPQHDVFCAGFPCQPFSLAGKKKGAKCPESGKLIDDVLRIVAHHLPTYVFLENVPNVMTIADGEFWNYIRKGFKKLGYVIDHHVYSPVQFDIPQQRQRLFIVARRPGESTEFTWPEPAEQCTTKLLDYLNVKSVPDKVRSLEDAKLKAVEKWNQLVKNLPELTSHTILAEEFGATYPLDGLKPNTRWRKCRGAFGVELAKSTCLQGAVELLPSYAAENGGIVPKWLQPYVLASRRIYQVNPDFFDHWKRDVVAMPKSWQKFEWRGDRMQRDIWRHTIQFRASGIRVMRPELAPSLVAMTSTQTPIIGPRKRYLGVREAASLQALEGLRHLPESNRSAFRALGNAVNAKIVQEIAKRVLQ